LEKGNKNTYYTFYLIIPSNFSKIFTNQLLNIKSKYKCNIYFILLKGKIINLINTKQNITFQNYYLLLIGELIPKKIKKCLYLNTNILVNKDLSCLFNIDMKNNYIAGVVSPKFNFSEKKKL